MGFMQEGKTRLVGNKMKARYWTEIIENKK